ncbi:hypothetical protein DM01DRAFT_1080493 [Hesseltinella vesiculosa]|uniref:Uncharacterized protein n=1 Tax=Hesseltinella vesiculosa TaxID=101127 RepID=A0A1X2GDV7_9FUNG|nr:hypothetical protein DM01DRAFT_1080493 [Hesseltinella vesiculosa]
MWVLLVLIPASTPHELTWPLLPPNKFVLLTVMTMPCLTMLLWSRLVMKKWILPNLLKEPGHHLVCLPADARVLSAYLPPDKPSSTCPTLSSPDCATIFCASFQYTVLYAHCFSNPQDPIIL